MAARSFREHDGNSSGIGTVMKKVGLTKGGFYRHFESEDDLFVGRRALPIPIAQFNN
jgi:TetR/AcrR family transcriptional repressor of nem operon